MEGSPDPWRLDLARCQPLSDIIFGITSWAKIVVTTDNSIISGKKKNQMHANIAFPPRARLNPPQPARTGFIQQRTRLLPFTPATMLRVY